MKPLFFVFLFNASTLVGQYSISGKIIDSDNQPIAYATISTYPVSDTIQIRSSISNEKGIFLIADLKSVKYKVIIQMLGFKDLEMEVLLNENKVLQNVVLQTDVTELNEIEVIAENSTIENKLGKKVLLIGKDLSNTGSTALEAMERILSVTTTQGGGLQIRGSSNVIVYINGKETTRDPRMLQHIPAEVLEKIEVITNPSAKYDAEGVTGIINLVYRKNKKKPIKIGILGNISLPQRILGGFNTNYNKATFSFYSNATVSYGKAKNLEISERKNNVGDLRFYRNKLTYEGIGKQRNLDAGITYHPDSTLAVDFELNYNRWNDAADLVQDNFFEYRSIPESSSFTTLSGRRELEDEATISLGMTKSFDNGKELKTLVSVSGEDENNDSRYDDLEPDIPAEVAQQFLKSSIETESQRLLQGKLDYETPFFNLGVLQTGVKLDNISYAILQKVTFQDNAITLPDNDFEVEQKKYAAYALHKREFNRFEYEAGLRLEHFSSDGLQQSNNSRSIQKTTKLFPSLQLFYKINDRQQTVGLSYSRRINRPGFFDVNPYVLFSDPVNLETGNPDLKPELASQFELNYHLKLGDFTSDLTGFYRRTTDVIQSIIKPLNNNQTLQTLANFDERSDRGIEALFEYNPKSVFKAYATFTLNHSVFNDDVNVTIFNRTTAWGARLDQQLKFKKNWIANFSQHYRAPSFEPQSKTASQFFVNFSLSKKFNNGKGSISLNARDIFNQRVFETIVKGADFSVDRSYKWQTRRITLGLQYTIFE